LYLTALLDLNIRGMLCCPSCGALDAKNTGGKSEIYFYRFVCNSCNTPFLSNIVAVKHNRCDGPVVSKPLQKRGEYKKDKDCKDSRDFREAVTVLSGMKRARESVSMYGTEVGQMNDLVQYKMQLDSLKHDIERALRAVHSKLEQVKTDDTYFKRVKHIRIPSAMSHGDSYEFEHDSKLYTITVPEVLPDHRMLDVCVPASE
jgi:hypothetical protein